MTVEAKTDDFPICPYCDHRHDDAWEWGSGGEEADFHECDSCGKQFYWSRSNFVSYTTVPVNEPSTEGR